MFKCNHLPSFEDKYICVYTCGMAFNTDTCTHAPSKKLKHYRCSQVSQGTT